MKILTYLSTDWVRVHDRGRCYFAKILVGDDNNAYMITIKNHKRQFFKIDKKLLKYNELEFFGRVMKTAKRLNIKQAKKDGII